MDRDTRYMQEEAQHAAELLEFGDAFFELDRDWRIVRVNRLQEKLSGLARSQTVGRTFAEIWPELATPSSRYWREYDRCMRERVPVQFQAYYAPLDLWTGVTAYPVSTGGIAVFFRDISAIKSAEREQIRLAAIVESTDDAVISKNLDGVVVTWNPGAERLFRYTADEMIGRPIGLLLPADRSGEEDRILAELRAGRRIDHFETKRVRKDGVVVDVSVSVAPLRDGSGELVGASKIARDITDRRRAEQALRASEHRLRATHERLRVQVDSMPLAVVEWDSQYRVIGYSGRAQEMFGWSSDEVIGKRIDELPWIPEEDWPAVRAVMRDMSSGARATNVNANRNVRKDGKVISCEWYNSTLHDESGRLVAVLSLVLDVTKRERAIEALRNSEGKFRSVFEQAAIGMGRVRFDDARWIDVNGPFCAMLGRSREEMLATPWPEMTHPDDVALDLVPFRRMAAGELDSYAVEKRFIHADGHHVWAKLTLSLVRDVNGRPDYEIAIVEDVTERKRAQEALHESERKYRSLFENMPMAFAYNRVVYEDGRAIDFVPEELNSAYSTNVGIPREAALGRRFTEIVSSEREAEQVRRMIEIAGEVTRTGHPTTYEVHLPSLGRWFEAVGYSPCPERYAVIFRDTTAQRTLERDLKAANARLEEADRRKDEFLGMLSHELRNPLAPIRNALYILDHAEPNGHQARRAKEVASRQVAHLTRLVDDLLDVTRVARGKIELRRVKLDLGALARATAEDYRPLMHERGLELVVAVPDEALLVDGDETRLAQVLGNLLSNAAKFTLAGGRVTLAVQKSGGRAVVHVRDTGVGITPDLLPTIFDPFIQAKQTLARSEGGLGLGLALVKGLTELHRGRVSAMSGGPGTGTEFTVELPLVQGLRTPQRPHRVAGTRRTYRVLVVDDNVDAAESLAELVRLFGHEVEVAYDGPSALATAAAHCPDIVLCDIGLPGMDGYEVAKALRARLDRKVQLVAVSGYAQPEDVKKSTDAGFDAHVAKPADPERIEHLLA